MKKQLFILGFILSALTVSAQEESVGDDYALPDGFLAVELQANPFSNDFNTFKMTELKARLWLTNQHVVRFGLGIGMDTNNNDNNWNFDSSADDDANYDIIKHEETNKTRATELRLSLGYEYHMKQTGRLDFYVGASAGYEATFYSGTSESNETWTRQGKGSYVLDPSGAMASTAGGYSPAYIHTPDYSRSLGQKTVTDTRASKDYSKMSPDGSKMNGHTIFANVFTGVDCYIYKGLYIGTELGLSFKHGKSKNGSYTQESSETVFENGVLTTNVVDKLDSASGLQTHEDYLKPANNYTNCIPASDKSSSSNQLKIYVEPAIRIGWMF